MSQNLEQCLLKKYGATMTPRQLAKETGLALDTIYGHQSIKGNGKFTFRPFRVGAKAVRYRTVEVAEAMTRQLRDALPSPVCPRGRKRDVPPLT